MAGVVVRTGRGRLLNLGANKVAVADLVIGLFVNNATLTESSVLADLTEMSTHGYAAKTPGAANWTVTEAATTTVVAAEQTWTFTAAAAVDVYGYFVKLGTVLVCAEKFSDGPYPVANTGDQIKVTPTTALT